MASMIMHCIIGVDIAAIPINPPNHKHFYHFGACIVNTRYRHSKIMINRQDSNVVRYLIYLRCFISICGVVIGLFAVFPNNSFVAVVTKHFKSFGAEIRIQQNVELSQASVFA